MDHRARCPKKHATSLRKKLSVAVTIVHYLFQCIIIACCIFYHPLGDSGVQHLAAALSTLPSLTILDLTSNGITHKGLSFVASALTIRDSTSSGTQQV